jgi:hypothetical protein
MGFACLMAVAFFIHSPVMAQDRSITVFQYRHVPDKNIEEFLKRETTYWSKVAEKAAKSKTMTFWAVLEKVGGYDLPNSSNYLFVNTFPDIDKIGDVFNNVEATAGVKMAAMETNSLSTTTSEIFMHDVGSVQKDNTTDNDVKYVVVLYHNTGSPDSLIQLENKYWAPFIKGAMNSGQTPQVGWGNSIILAPLGGKMTFSTISYDLYKTLGDALMPKWDPKTVFPNTGLGMIGALETGARGMSVYRVVKAVSSPQ